ERRQRLARVAGAEQRRTLEPQRPPVVGVACERALGELQRAARLALLCMDLADADEQVDGARVQRQRAIVLSERIVQLAGLLEQPRVEVEPHRLLARVAP